jgi:hypothetical protein
MLCHLIIYLSSSNVIIASNTYTLQVFTVSYLTFNGYSELDPVEFTTSGGTKDSAVCGSGRHFALDNVFFNLYMNLKNKKVFLS